MGAKRKAEDSNENSGADHELTDYERQRAAIIARNRERLQAMGVKDAYDSFSATFAALKPEKKKQKKVVAKSKAEPSRKSSRLQGEGNFFEPSELAFFTINDECPRCGKVIIRGHKKHLESCSESRLKKEGVADGIDEEGDDDEDEAEEDIQPRSKTQKPSTAKTEAAKLSELELSGLVELTQDKAEFVILGSTGSHYRVVFEKDGKGFGDGKSSCQCMDYRLRRHTCKHIRLVLKQLKLEKNADDWHKAIEDQLGALQPSGKEEDTQSEEKPQSPTSSAGKASKPSKGSLRKTSGKSTPSKTRKIGRRKLPASFA